MKFNDFKYERPNYEQFKNEFGALVYKFEAATNAEEQLEIVKKINAHAFSYRNNGNLIFDSP